MKIRFLGCSWETKEDAGLGLEDFFDWLVDTFADGRLVELTDSELARGQRRRRLFVSKVGDYYTGLIVTSRDGDWQGQLESDGTTSKLTFAKAAESNWAINMFAVRNDTWRGLFTNFPRTLALHGFEKLMKRLYAVRRQELRTTESSGLSEEIRAEKKLLKDIARRYSKQKSLSVAPLTQREKFLRSLEAAQLVHEVFYQDVIVVGPMDDDNPLRKARKRATREKHAFVYQSTPPDLVRGAIDYILSKVTSKTYHAGGVIVSDSNGERQVLNFKSIERFAVFEEWEFGRLVEKMLSDLVLERFNDTALMSHLKKLLKEPLFVAPAD